MLKCVRDNADDEDDDDDDRPALSSFRVFRALDTSHSIRTYSLARDPSVTGVEE